ncbi:MAG: phosphatase PAP2 family protein [Oscillospiraceae bacterium]|nr:phosphatase PAP2 family protein [Oscillospiraceae bacterium]
MLLGMLLGFVIGNLCLKNLIRRARPCWIDGTVQARIPDPSDYSFPSGHTLSSFIAAFTVFRTNKKCGIPALVLASLIAFSRLYLFVHFPTDVIAGILLGWVLVPAADAIAEKIFFLKTND